MLKVTIADGGSPLVRGFSIKFSIRLTGALQVRSDDNDVITDANKETMPEWLFDLMYGLVDLGPALSVVCFAQADTVYFSAWHKESDGWTKEDQGFVKDRILEAFEYAFNNP